MRKKYVWGKKINIIQIIDHSLRLLAFVNRVRWRTNFHVCSKTGLSVLDHSDSCFQELRRSNPTNQVRRYYPTSTLWVLETCLNVGLLPLMIILITASLSSNTYNKASWVNKINIIQMIDHSRTETIRSHSSRACIPSNLNPASKEMISDSVELTVRNWSLFLTQPTYSEQMYYFQKTHKVPPDVDFESSTSPAKSESWNSPSLHCFAVFPTWQYCLYSHVWWM